MTNTYNTLNPLGSTSPKDLFDNASNFDDGMNSESPSFYDRFMKRRETWAGMEVAFEASQEFREDAFNAFLLSSGYETPVDYAPGILIERPTQIIRYLGELYRPKDSALPFTTTTFPADEAKWIASGDNSLRQDLGNFTDHLKGATLVGFNGRNVGDRLRDELNARDYGAVGGTGVDETLNLQAAIDATPVGGTLFIPAGRWEYTGLVVNKPMVIRGAGGPATSLYSTTATGNGIEFVGAGIIYQTGVKDLRFGSTVNATAGSALRFADVGHGFIENVWVSGALARPYIGVSLHRATQFSIVNLQINDCNNTGLTLGGHCIDVYISNSRSDANNGDGIQIKDSEGVYCSNVTAYFNDGAAWRFPYGGANENKNMFFTNCVGDSSGSANWLIEDLRSAFFANCWASTQKAPTLPFAAGFLCLKASGANLDRLHFANCVASNNNSHGFRIESGSYCSITNCISEANGLSGDGSGFRVESSENVTISQIKALSNATFGIFVGAGCPNFSITDSTSRFNTAGAYESSTTGSVVRNLIGFKTSNIGTGVIASADTSVLITHGLDITPLAGTIQVTPLGNTTSDYGNTWINNINSSSFTVNVRNSPGASTLQFGWSVSDM